MNSIPRFAQFSLVVLAGALTVCGCHGNQQQTQAASAAQQDQPSDDPATANLAPVAGPAYQAPPAATPAYQGSPSDA
jgi:ABC-type uncharacterized transport system auxiliary subunit